MIIYRKRHGELESYVLTKEEMVTAYYEQQHEWDKDYILNNLIDLFNDDGSYDDLIDELETNPQLLKRIAFRYRKYIEDLNSVDDKFECFLDAVRYCKAYS